MLVFKRGIGRTIVIDHNITVMVTDIAKDGRWCKIGVAAPRNIAVHREEVEERIRSKELPPNGDHAGERP